jgi:hypothetical protein
VVLLVQEDQGVAATAEARVVLLMEHTTQAVAVEVAEMLQAEQVVQAL